MKEYLVTSDYGDWNNMWIVAAKNARDAIDQVWQQHILPMNHGIKEDNKEYGYKAYRCCRRDELHAQSIESLHKKSGKIYCVN